MSDLPKLLPELTALTPELTADDTIAGFRDLDDKLIIPQEVGKYLNSPVGVRLPEHYGLGDDLYILDKSGSLIAEDATLPRYFRWGFGVLIGPGVRFVEPKEAETADFDPVVHETVIGSGSAIFTYEGGPQKILSGLELAARSVLRAKSVGQSVTIRRRVMVEHGTTIGSGTVIGDDAKIRRDVVIGDEVEIGPYATINSGAKVRKGATVKRGAVVYDNVAPGVTVEANTLRDPLL